MKRCNLKDENINKLFFIILFMRGKKGQFYLIATIIIIAVIIGFATISNYAQRQDYVKIYDLGEELNIESENVLDYGAATGNSKLSQFGKDYSEYAGEDIEIYFITGDESGMEAHKYVNGEETLLDAPEVKEDEIIFKLNENEYVFELKPGENFYFIILQEADNEKYVITN